MIWSVLKLLIKSQKFQKIRNKNNSETVANEKDKEMPKERYISPEKWQEITYDLRLK